MRHHGGRKYRTGDEGTCPRLFGLETVLFSVPQFLYKITAIGQHFIITCGIRLIVLVMYVYSYCNALSARFFAVDRALNSYVMIMIIMFSTCEVVICHLGWLSPPGAY